MIKIRRAVQRQHTTDSRQDVRLSFYPEDKQRLVEDGFGVLQVLNEIRLAPGADMTPRSAEEAEVFTYVIDGSLAQEDSSGFSGVLLVGEFQRMTSGLRVRISERNASEVDWAHIIRLSLKPSEAELDCTREQKFFSVAERRGNLRVVGSPDGRKGSLRCHLNALIYSAILDEGQHIVHPLASGRIAWLHVVSGEAKLGDTIVSVGDGAGVSDEPTVSLTAREATEILLVDIERRRDG